VEVVKRAIDAFNRRDVDGFAELTTADFEWFPSLVVVEGGRGCYRGREGIEKYFEDVRDTWKELRVLGYDFRDLGDRVLVLSRAEGRGRGSGVRWMRRTRVWSTFAAARSRASAPISITARRCGRRASRSSGSGAGVR
jgi:ketosteroid isomerase-like protein